MIFTIEEFGRYDEEKMTLIKKWWHVRQKIEINERFFSDSGFMIFDDDKEIAALFLYPIIGSEIAWLGWPITNPETTTEQRNLALSMLFEAVHNKAKEMGYAYLWTTSGVAALQSRLESMDYTKGDENIDQYTKVL